MKDSNLSQGACVCEDEDTTTNLRECARRSVDVVAGVRIVKCHASVDVVIDARIVECHASILVVIGIRVVLSHPLIDFSTFLDFHFVPKFSSCCHAVTIHHDFYPVVILHTFCTEEIRPLRSGIYTTRRLQ